MYFLRDFFLLVCVAAAAELNRVAISKCVCRMCLSGVCVHATLFAFICLLLGRIHSIKSKIFSVMRIMHVRV